MGSEKEMIFEKIDLFRKHIARIQQEGLIKESEINDIAPLITEEESFSPTARKRRVMAKLNHLTDSRSV